LSNPDGLRLEPVLLVHRASPRPDILGMLAMSCLALSYSSKRGSAMSKVQKQGQVRVLVVQSMIASGMIEGRHVRDSIRNRTLDVSPMFWFITRISGRVKLFHLVFNS